jgi:hypothetical protein
MRMLAVAAQSCVGSLATTCISIYPDVHWPLHNAWDTTPAMFMAESGASTHHSHMLGTPPWGQ